MPRQDPGTHRFEAETVGGPIRRHVARLWTLIPIHAIPPRHQSALPRQPLGPPVHIPTARPCRGNVGVACHRSAATAKPPSTALDSCRQTVAALQRYDAIATLTEPHSLLPQFLKRLTMQLATVHSDRHELHRRNSRDNVFRHSRPALQLANDRRRPEPSALQFQGHHPQSGPTGVGGQKKIVALPGGAPLWSFGAIHVDQTKWCGRAVGLHGATVLVHRVRHAALVDALVDPFQHRQSVVLVGFRRFDPVGDPGPLVVQGLGNLAEPGGKAARVGVEPNLLNRRAGTV